MNLRNKIIFYLVLPVIAVLLAVVGVDLWRSHDQIVNNQKSLIEKELSMVANQLDRNSIEAVSVARTMAIAQMNGMFGKREETIAFSRRILQVNPQFVGSYIGYEPNADRKDAAEIKANPDFHPWTDDKGRFLPYWYRGEGKKFINLERLTDVDESTNLYYQKMKEVFQAGSKDHFIVTEPYLNKHKSFIVEHSSPIYFGRKFVGVTGISRSLTYLNEFLLNLKPFETAQFYLISGRGHVVASTLDTEIRTLSVDDFYIKPNGRVMSDGLDWNEAGRLTFENLDQSSIAYDTMSDEYAERFKAFLYSAEAIPATLFDDPITQEKGYIACATIPTGNWRIIMTVSQSEILSTARQSMYYAIVTGIVGLILVLILIVLFSNRLSKRIVSANALAQRVAMGDLTSRLPAPNTTDETGQLQEAINSMVKSLNHLLLQVKQATVQLVTTATSITKTAKQQEDTIHDFSDSTKQIATAVEQITVTSKDLYGTMSDVSDSASETAQLAESGREQLSQMSDSMTDLSQSTSAISERLGVIKDKTRNINQVITTITKISEQTNILSLNAAIEAEKAGEYGLGFSVVAREIRRLAKETAQATLDIHGIVKEMQDSVESGVTEMNAFTEKVSSDVDEVNGLSGSLAKIINQVQELTPRFDSVKVGMESQNVGAEQISEAMEQLKEGVERTTDSLEKFDSATKALNQSVAGLRGEVSRFSIKEPDKNKESRMPFPGKVKTKKK